MLASTEYEPGLNSRAKRLPPNWLVCCWPKTELSLAWVGVEGSKRLTFGPRSGLFPVGGGLPRLKDWAVVPLHVYCWSCTLSPIEAPGTSRHLPLCRLTKW